MADALSQPVLRFDGVSKRYPGGQEALLDISFAVARGWMVFVTGPSGAGKRTLLRLINLAERPSNGAVLFDARPLASVRGRRVALDGRQGGGGCQVHRWLT